MDNDTRFSKAFCKILSDVDIESMKIAPRCPNMNAYMERFMKSIKHNQLIIPPERPPDKEAPFETVERLGGMPKHYRRAA